MLNYNNNIENHAQTSHVEARSIIYLPDSPKTLNDVLTRAAFHAPDRGVTFIEDNGDEKWLSYAEKLLEAKSFLAGLQEKGVKKGDKIILQIGDKYKFTIAFWGALLGGIIPAPVASSFSLDPNKKNFEKLVYIWNLLDKPYIATDYLPPSFNKGLTLADSPEHSILKKHDALDIQALDFETFPRNAEDAHIEKVTPEDIAFLQFTSGSTGNPKGVILTHGNLVANVHSIVEASEMTASDITINWMPFYHDMGLIGSYLTAILSMMNSLQMSPFAFIKRPELLLKKISEHKATLLGTPNFGLKRILEKLDDEALSKYDLSSMRLIYNGAEPISIPFVHQFLAKMIKFTGLKEEHVMFPVYGMAEACLGVAFPQVGNTFHYHCIDRNSVGVGDSIRFVPEQSAEAVCFAEEGFPVSGLEIRIVDDNDNVLNEEVIGHVQMRGPNVTQGYYKNPEATRYLKCGDWARTGDIGFVRDQRLTITGRSKDIIFC